MILHIIFLRLKEKKYHQNVNVGGLNNTDGVKNSLMSVNLQVRGEPSVSGSVVVRDCGHWGELLLHS